MRRWLFILIPCLQLQAQNSRDCILKDPPTAIITFGSGNNTDDVNMGSLNNYQRVSSTCPTDGHYTYTHYTSECFRDDWITIEHDHTGDADGNVLLVNAAYEEGEFFSTIVQGLSPGKRYEFSVWMVNVCKPSDKCPFPLLPNITVNLSTLSGKPVTSLISGGLPRYGTDQWTKFAILFDLPAGANSLLISMNNTSPGGCGNDFAIDDLTFRECIPPPPPVASRKKVATAKTVTKAPVQKPATSTAAVVKPKPVAPPVKKPATTTATKKAPATASVPVATAKSDSLQTKAIAKPNATAMRPPPTIMTTRKNSLVKTFQVEEGDIRIDLYDNGEIDGDTVTVYHNNTLIVSHGGLSDKAITFHLAINPNSPHHELVMVADNLGSIPPNTSLMVVTTGGNRYEVFISSSEQNNAKVVFDLKP